MNDNKIIKALTICSTKGASCKDCPAFEKVDRSKCKQVLVGALGIITRLQAKNKELNETIKKLEDSIKDHQYANCVGITNGLIYTHTLDDYENFIEDVSNEAVKEFAQKVIEKVEKASKKYQRLCAEQGDKEDEAMNIHFRGMINIVKEIAGENNA